MAVLDDLIAEILARGHVNLSPTEAEALSRAPATHAIAPRLLCADAFNRGDYAAAMKHGKRAHIIRPDAETEENLISCMMRSGAWEDAIALLSQSSRMSMTRRHSLLAELHARAGHWEQAHEAGRKALKLKDASVPQLTRRFAPAVHRFDPEQPQRNIISFSLFGTGKRYLDGAIRNAVVARHLYPGWTARFYIDASIPDPVRKALVANGAQLRQVDNLPAARYGLFWRFLVEDDPEVLIYIIRDADAVLNIRERVAVQDWLDSDKPFHLMRDYPSHCELILAGLWGAHRGNIGSMGKRILAHVKANAAVTNDRTADQKFLAAEVWPLMRERLFCQDSAFGFGQTQPFNPAFPLPSWMHVGQDDGALSAQPQTPAKPDSPAS